jgi:hypothetical protein
MRTARSRPSSAEPAEPEPTDRGPAPEAPVASLEQALEFIRDDEAVEVTPEEHPPPQGRALGNDAPDDELAAQARARRHTGVVGLAHDLCGFAHTR